MKMGSLPKRLFLTQVGKKWEMEVAEVMSCFLGRNIVFTLLEHVERLIEFYDHISDSVIEKYDKKDLEFPEALGLENFLRVPVSDEYLEIMIKKGVWEGRCFIHSFKGTEMDEIIKSASVYSLYENKIVIKPEDLYVHATDLLIFEEENKQDLLMYKSKKSARNEVDSRSETTYLNIIGVLLRVISGNQQGMKKHPDYTSDAKLIEQLIDRRIQGLSKSTLESKFADAKRYLSANY